MSSLLKRIGRFILSVFWTVLTLSVLALCIAFGRLLVAPVNLDFAREEIIMRAEGLLPGWQVDFKSAEIGWDWSSVRPWLNLEDVSLIDRRDRLKAYVPEAHVGIGFAGVLSGIGVTTITLDQAYVRILDLGGFSDSTDDSLFDELFGAGGIPKPEVFLPLTEAFTRFSGRLLENFPEFESVRFSSLSLDLYRGENLSNALFHVSTLTLTHQDADLALSAQADITIGGNPVSLRMNGSSTSEGALSALVAVSDFYASSFTPDQGFPEFLQYIHLPMAVSVGLELNSIVGLRSARIEASLGQGDIYDSKVFPYPAPVDYGLIIGNYDAAEHTFAVNSIDLALGRKKVSGSGVLYWQEAAQDPGVQFDLRTDDIAIADILKYWPTTFHDDGRERGARAWISKNMLKGKTNNVLFQVAVAPDGTGELANGSPYYLTFDYEDLDTRFVRTMPPILDARGSAALTEADFRINMNGGTLLGMPVDGSSALLRDINIPYGAVGDFQLFTRGPIQTVMTLIDHPPLRVAEKAKLEIGRLSGTATLKADVSLPLLNEMPEDAIRYDVSAQLQDGGVADLLGGDGLRAADLALKVTNEGITAAGNGRLNGVPVNLRWQEKFGLQRGEVAEATPESSLIVVSGVLDGQDLSALNIDVEDYLLGAAPMEISLHGNALKFTRGTFSADVSETVLAVPQLSWRKDTGQPATLTGSLFLGDAVTKVSPLRVVGENIDVTANLTFAEGQFDGFFDVQALGRNAFNAQLHQDIGGAIEASITAARFDLGAYLAPSVQASPVGPVPRVDVADVGETSANAPLHLKLESEKVLLRNGEEWQATSADLTMIAGEPVALSLRASIAGQEQPLLLTIVDTPDAGDQTRPIAASGADGGAVLRGLGFFSHVKGGDMVFTGTTKGWGETWQVNGELALRDGQVLARADLPAAVEEGTIDGINSYLEDGPITLDVLDVPFTYQNNLLGLNNLKANGPTLGLTMEGEIATASGLINVNGVVVPAYGINSLLGNIPILGSLFTGGEGKGLFGVTYRVKGTTEAPDVSFSALSGLAPGFLRLLFEGRKGRVADIEAQPAPQQQPTEHELER